MQTYALTQKGIYDLPNSRSGDWIRLFIVVFKEFRICACEEKNKDMERFLGLHTPVTRSGGARVLPWLAHLGNFNNSMVPDPQQMLYDYSLMK